MPRTPDVFPYPLVARKLSDHFTVRMYKSILRRPFHAATCWLAPKQKGVSSGIFPYLPWQLSDRMAISAGGLSVNREGSTGLKPLAIPLFTNSGSWGEKPWFWRLDFISECVFVRKLWWRTETEERAPLEGKKAGYNAQENPMRK